VGPSPVSSVFVKDELRHQQFEPLREVQDPNRDNPFLAVSSLGEVEPRAGDD
jgi:hypothetical protein